MSYELFFDSIIFKLARAADWRAITAAKFPDDPRNRKAAIELLRLSEAVYSDVRPATWEEIAPYVDSDAINGAINIANRSVGFATRPADINEYLLSVAEFANGLALPANLRVHGAA